VSDAGGDGAGRDRPVVGVTAYASRARWGVWDLQACILPQTYVESVVHGGGIPVILPPLPGLVEAVLPRLDALVVAGGPDVDPARYGAEPGPDTQPPDLLRDAAETELLAAATALGMPVLGICRGMQLMNVVRGGTLAQHLPDVVGTDEHCPTPGRYARHDVQLVAGTRLATALGDSPELSVPTYHHQGIGEVGAGLVVGAVAPDGVVEAVEDPTLPFWLGVQWHPEAGQDRSLFRALVAAAVAARQVGARQVGARQVGGR